MRGRYKRSKESRQRSSEARKKYFTRDKTARSKVAKNTKKQWENPETRETILNAVRIAGNKKEVKEKRRQAAFKRWRDKEFREKVIPLMSGINNHRYNPDRSQVLHRGGKGFLKSQVKRLKEPSCKWCGSRVKLQLDHIVPVCAGGGSEDSNAQTLCVKCNNKKRDTYDLVLMKSYRIRGTSDRVKPKTIPSQADKKSSEVCRDYGVAPKGMI